MTEGEQKPIDLDQFAKTAKPARIPDDKSAITIARLNLFNLRFARIKGLLDTWQTNLEESDWRIRLARKALYSTWCDIKELMESTETPSGPNPTNP
ncbi:hypothetical protein M1437_03605 [Patescibacteria group bacterium]|nr:hypothetical protein [Patescibacteria group bacterium]